MRRTLVAAALLATAVLILRELGIVEFSWFQRTEESTISVETEVPQLNASRIVFEPDTGKPYVPAIKTPDDFYQVTVRYRVLTSLSPSRWIPFYKFGSNRVQVAYVVWIENGLAGCGSIYMTGSQTIFGIASARNYESALTEPLVQRMKRELQPKFNLLK